MPSMVGISPCFILLYNSIFASSLFLIESFAIVATKISSGPNSAVSSSSVP